MSEAVPSQAPRYSKSITWAEWAQSQDTAQLHYTIETLSPDGYYGLAVAAAKNELTRRESQSQKP